MLPADEPVLMFSNRSFHYGDGLFETMRLKYGVIILGKYHFDRLFDSLALLKFEIPTHFTIEKIQNDIVELSRINENINGARVRLTVFRGNGKLADSENPAEYLIETEKLEQPFTFNEHGLKVDIYPFAQKPRDIFSNLKTTSYLVPAMANKFSRDHKLDDCILLNGVDRIAETTIANVFIVKEEKITTPAATEGCIPGVMRRYIMSALEDAGYQISEGMVRPEDLAEADEVFITNAIKGLNWVGYFRDKKYRSDFSASIFKRFIKTIQS